MQELESPFCTFRLALFFSSVVVLKAAASCEQCSERRHILEVRPKKRALVQEYVSFGVSVATVRALSCSA